MATTTNERPRVEVLDGRWVILGPDGELLAGPFETTREAEDWLDNAGGE